MFTWRDKSGAPACVCQKALNPEGCQNVIQQLKDRTEPGTHVTSAGSIETEVQQRDSDIAWFNDQELQNIIRGYVDIANYECGWRYDIVDSEQLQFTVYDGDKKQHYDWHTDSQCDHHMARRSMQFHKPKENNLMYTPQTNLLGTVRKLSVSAILND